MLKQNLREDSQEIELTAYRALVRPVLEYRVAAWDPHANKNINKLEGGQCSAARYMSRNYSTPIPLQY